MFDFVKKFNWKKTGIFAAGVLFGTAGIKILGSKDAKKVYTNCTAAALRARLLLISRKMQRIFMQRHSRLMKTELLKQQNIQMNL